MPRCIALFVIVIVFMGPFLTNLNIYLASYKSTDLPRFLVMAVLRRVQNSVLKLDNEGSYLNKSLYLGRNGI